MMEMGEVVEELELPTWTDPAPAARTPEKSMDWGSGAGAAAARAARPRRATENILTCMLDDRRECVGWNYVQEEKSVSE